jgi:hypothetical protein
VTNSRDTQELLPDAGQEMLRIFHTHPARTSLLQDFAFYEVCTQPIDFLTSMLTCPIAASHAKDAGTTGQRLAFPFPLSGPIDAFTSAPACCCFATASAATTPAADPIRHVSQSQCARIPNAADDAHDADADANGYGYGHGYGQPVWHPAGSGDAPKRHAAPQPRATRRGTKLHGNVRLLKPTYHDE